MKRILVAVMALALFSCSRDMDNPPPDSADLEGNWRMSSVKDNLTGFIHTKPGAITGDVDITFVAVSTGRGFINGKTPTNTLVADYSQYVLGAEGRITFVSLAASEVAETSWGLDFLNNITKSDTYSIEPGEKLRIHTEKKTLYFERN